MIEICLVCNSKCSVFLSSYKNSIVRRDPYKNSYTIISKRDGVIYIHPLSINRYYNTIQLKICKVS